MKEVIHLSEGVHAVSPIRMEPRGKTLKEADISVHSMSAYSEDFPGAAKQKNEL